MKRPRVFVVLILAVLVCFGTIGCESTLDTKQKMVTTFFELIGPVGDSADYGLFTSDGYLVAVFYGMTQDLRMCAEAAAIHITYYCEPLNR